MYHAVLFIHVLGATVLIGVVMMTLSGLLRAHRAVTNQQVRAAMSGVPVADRLLPPAMALVLGGGLYLVAAGKGYAALHWSAAWVVASLVVFAVMGVLGPAVESRRSKALLVAASNVADGPVGPEVDRLRRDPVLAHVTIFGAAQLVALLYLMTNRPALTGTLTAVVAAAVLSIPAARITLGTIPRRPDDVRTDAALVPEGIEGARQ